MTTFLEQKRCSISNGKAYLSTALQVSASALLQLESPYNDRLMLGHCNDIILQWLCKGRE